MRRSGSMMAGVPAFLLALWLGLPACALAAEQSVLGKVVQLTAERDKYSFQFEPRAGEPELIPGCHKLDIELRYHRRPEAWLPLSRGAYPSKKQTAAVVAFLKRALREGREIYLGSASGGLFPLEKSCTFASHALTLEYRGERELVMSYYGK